MRDYDLKRGVHTSSTFGYYATRGLVIALLASGGLFAFSKYDAIYAWCKSAGEARPVPHKKTFQQREAEAMKAEQTPKRPAAAGRPNTPRPAAVTSRPGEGGVRGRGWRKPASGGPSEAASRPTGRGRKRPANDSHDILVQK